MTDKKYKILLADDEENIRLLGEKLLTESGYQVITASNGAEAIEKAISERPDLVITDIRMPQKTGFEVCKALRSDPVLSQTPIIILSALGDEFNKLTGFEGGANDFITKPFRTEELKERVALVLEHSEARPKHQAAQRPASSTHPTVTSSTVSQMPTGCAPLDKITSGGFPKGSNILVIGALGKGKSTLARKFIIEGLKNNAPCLYVAVDDDPILIRGELGKAVDKNIKDLENSGSLRFVDAYSWVSGDIRKDESYKIEGVLNLEQLSDLIAQAGTSIGQSVQQKLGGRRIIDSISSFFINFDLQAVQKFLSQIGRTGIAFGGVTTLFIIEEGSVSEQSINSIKYLMDGVLELKEENGKKMFRIANMKWLKSSNDWCEWSV